MRFAADSLKVVMLALFAGIILDGGAPVWAEECPVIEEQPVKIEAWVSKRRAAEFPEIQKGFAAMGYTLVTLWAYPGENPSRIAAIGRCVPSYIAQYVLTQAVRYFGGVNGLVHQGFVSPHWIGLGTSLFADNSLKPIAPEQLARLLDPALDSNQFHALYRQFTAQDAEVRGFGLDLPNPKLMH